MLKRALLLTTGNTMTSLMLMVRNILIARLISVEDFGIAATFAITMALIEMMTQFGLQQMIVQDRKGNDENVQTGMHAFQAFRGVLAGLFLFLIAAPYANFLGVPEVAWAYQLIALVPAIRGFIHFDVFRQQREMRYWPFIISHTGAAMASLIIVLPLMLFFGDWRVMLYAIMGQYVLMVLFSHLMAERRYGLSWDTALMGRAVRFGWPLLVNGAMLWVIFNGERLVVGRELGMAELGIFSVALSLTLTPTLVLSGSAQSFFLPQLSGAQDDAKRFGFLYHVTVETSMVIGIAVAVGLALLGPPIAFLLLGEKYLPMLPLLAFLGIAQALRVGKQGIAIVSLGRAVTGNAMIANAPRVLAVLLVWYLVAEQGAGIMTVIVVAILAEMAGFCVALSLLRYKLRLPLQRLVLPIVFAALTLVVIGVDGLTHQADPGLLGHLHLAQIGYLLMAGCMLFAMKDFRRYLFSRIGGAGGKTGAGSGAPEPVLSDLAQSEPVLSGPVPPTTTPEAAPSNGPPTVPDLFLVAAPKAGSTTLARWLTDHPAVQGGTKKELRVLIDPEDPLSLQDGYHARGLAAFDRFFPDGRGDAQWLLDGSPEYYYQTTALDVIADIPGAHAIFVLRNPAMRIYSLFRFAQGNISVLPKAMTFPDFVAEMKKGAESQILADRPMMRDALRHGEYARYVQAWQDRLGKDRVTVVILEDFRPDPQPRMRALAERLGLDPRLYETYDFPSENPTVTVRNQPLHIAMRRSRAVVPSVVRKPFADIYWRMNTSVQRAPITDADRTALAELGAHFAPWNSQLAELIGRKAPLWPKKSLMQTSGNTKAAS